MSTVGKVRVVVKSRRVPVRTVEFTHPIFPIGTSSGANLRRERAVVYESVFDEEHRRAINEGHQLACSLGLDLEILDRSKLSLFRRLLWSIGGDSSGAPNVMVFPSDRGATESLTHSDPMPIEAV